MKHTHNREHYSVKSKNLINMPGQIYVE